MKRNLLHLLFTGISDVCGVCDQLYVNISNSLLLVSFGIWIFSTLFKNCGPEFNHVFISICVVCGQAILLAQLCKCSNCT
jgi:hypothetical protein